MMNTDEVLNKLKEDYILRSLLKKKDLNVQEELEEEIEDLEQAYITSKIMPQIETYAKDLLKDLECEAYISIIKDANGNIRVSNECCCDVMTDTRLKNELNDSPVEVKPAAPILLSSNNIKEALGRDLRITYNGKVFQGQNAKKVFLDTLEDIGLERVQQVGIYFVKKQYNLVDRRQRTDGGHDWQEYRNGYWIYIYYSNPEKVRYLLKIAKYYNLDIKIEAINNQS